MGPTVQDFKSTEKHNTANTKIFTTLASSLKSLSTLLFPSFVCSYLSLERLSRKLTKAGLVDKESRPILSGWKDHMFRSEKKVNQLFKTLKDPLLFLFHSPPTMAASLFYISTIPS